MDLKNKYKSLNCNDRSLNSEFKSLPSTCLIIFLLIHFIESFILAFNGWNEGITFTLSGLSHYCYMFKKKKIIIPKPMQLYMYILLVIFSEQYFKDRSLKFHCTCLETDNHLHFRLCCSDSFCRFCQSPAWSFAILEWWSHFSRICWWGWYCLEYIYKRNQNIISWYTNGVNTCNSI